MISYTLRIREITLLVSASTLHSKGIGKQECVYVQAQS